MKRYLIVFYPVDARPREYLPRAVDGRQAVHHFIMERTLHGLTLPWAIEEYEMGTEPSLEWPSKWSSLLPRGTSSQSNM